MRHYRDARAIADAMVAEFEAEGARIVDLDGFRFAVFTYEYPGHPMSTEKINIDRLAGDIERRLSCPE